VTGKAWGTVRGAVRYGDKMGIAHGGQMPGRWDDREKHIAPDWAKE
jgi:hypothetical protein